MRRQTLTVMPDRPVFIETVHGVIEICRKGKSFAIIMPDDLRAWHTSERLINNAQFLKIETPDSVKPNYSVIVPRIDESGHLVGVKTPEPIFVGGRS